ncbi:MAG: ferredoxin:thioredoxin reductase [Spirochaetaceae bacterium]|nr:ferredoxin:thioredoxin reductase [Spirochaetaceae bacterium]
MAHPLDKFAHSVAEKNGWSVQPDQEMREQIMDGLLTNKKRYGFMLCPCRDSWGDVDYDRDIICPCIYAKQDIDEEGRCYCALFCRKGSDGFQNVYVEDRRPEELYP